MNENEINSLLTTVGLCEKAGRLIPGTERICDALRDGVKAPLLVLEAADTSENTHKRLTDRCTYYKIRHCRLEAGSVRLGAALGKSAVAAVGITDAGFCRLFEKKLGIN